MSWEESGTTKITERETPFEVLSVQGQEQNSFEPGQSSDAPRVPLGCGQGPHSSCHTSPRLPRGYLERGGWWGRRMRLPGPGAGRPGASGPRWAEVTADGAPTASRPRLRGSGPTRSSCDHLTAHGAEGQAHAATQGLLRMGQRAHCTAEETEGCWARELEAVLQRSPGLSPSPAEFPPPPARLRTNGSDHSPSLKAVFLGSSQVSVRIRR